MAKNKALKIHAQGRTRTCALPRRNGFRDRRLTARLPGHFKVGRYIDFIFYIPYSEPTDLAGSVSINISKQVNTKHRINAELRSN